MINNICKNIKFIFLALVSILFASCSDDDKTNVDQYFFIEGEPSGYTASPQAVTVNYVIRSNKPWKIEARDDTQWSRFFPSEGKDDGIVSLIIKENETFDVRNVNYAFIVDGIEQPVLFSVTQEGNVPYITITDAQKGISVPGAGGEFIVAVKANVDWSYIISDDSWIELVSQSSTQIIFNAAENEGSEREAVFTAVSVDYPALSQTILITQSSAEYILEEDFSWLSYGKEIHYETSGKTRYDLWTDAEKSRGWYSTPVASSDNQQLCYARPGFVKLGKTNFGGDLITPALSAIEGEANVEVTFKATAYISKGGAKDDNELFISIIGPGEVSQSLFIIDNYPNSGNMENGADYDVWDPSIAQRSFEIKGATSETKIKFLGGAYELTGIGQGKNRIFLDDIKVKRK